VTVGGHTYEDKSDWLVGGGGTGVYGNVFVARDGQAKWVQFHFEGIPAYQGGGVWNWLARMTVKRVAAFVPVTFGRQYVIARTGLPCPPNTGRGTYERDPSWIGMRAASCHR
jgi:hypothetical protein